MYVLAVFLNRTETIRFQNELKKIGVNAAVVSTAKGLGSSCSVAVKFYLKNLSRAIVVLNKGNYKSFNNFFKIVYQKQSVRYEIIRI
jgi:hypothetical protein